MMLFVQEMFAALRRLFADKNARTTMLISILIYAVIYPQPYVDEVVRDIPIVAIDQDGSNTSREFLRRLDSADTVQIVSTLPDMVQAEQMYYARQAYGIVLIPPSFERDLLAGGQAPVAAFGDGSYFILYGGLAEAVNTVARDMGAQIRLGRLVAQGADLETASALVAPVGVASVPLFNPHSGFASYIVPAAFVLIIQQTFLMGIGIMHAGRPLRRGITRVATPVAYLLLYLALIAVTQILLPMAYGLPQLGDPWVLLVLSVSFVMAVMAMGFALIQLIPSREGVVFFLVVQGMPLFFVSGVAWPLESIAEPLRSAMMIFPSTSALRAFIQIDQMGAGLAQILPVVKLQLGLALGYVILGYGLLRLQYSSAR